MKIVHFVNNFDLEEVYWFQLRFYSNSTLLKKLLFIIWLLYYYNSI